MVATAKLAVLLVAGGMWMGGCATKGQLRTSAAEQSAALRKAMDDQKSNLDAERAERIAADEQFTKDLAQLRTDLNSMRTEFGAKIAAVENGLQFVLPVHFAFDRAEVRAEDQMALDRFAQVVSKHYGGATVTVEGFADPAGSRAYNRKLSARRADAVRAYLIDKSIQAQLRTVGYGEDRLVMAGAAKEEMGAELNRRVTFVIESPSNTSQTAALDR
jgi:outer membrane protein OmpA-like peptidoglycan-associated protein